MIATHLELGEIRGLRVQDSLALAWIAEFRGLFFGGLPAGGSSFYRVVKWVMRAA